MRADRLCAISKAVRVFLLAKHFKDSKSCVGFYRGPHERFHCSDSSAGAPPGFDERGSRKMFSTKIPALNLQTLGLIVKKK